GDAMRPVFLTFDGDVEPGEPFAHMVENGPLLAALAARAREVGVEILPHAIVGHEIPRSPAPERESERARHSQHVVVRLAVGGMIAAGPVGAADGALSGIRQRAGIVTRGWDYPQSSIVTTVEHERDHGGRAEEHFLPAGPFAILPLKGHRSSIVWTEATAEAERILALPDADFHVELERRFGLHLRA